VEQEVVMRCLILGALVMIASAGCGGPSGNPELRSDLRKESAARSQTDEAAIRKYRAAFGEDAVDTCVRVFDEDNLREHEQVDKPSSADLAAFLCSCVGASTCL
jgi:hypothetical protein